MATLARLARGRSPAGARGPRADRHATHHVARWFGGSSVMVTSWTWLSSSPALVMRMKRALLRSSGTDIVLGRAHMGFEGKWQLLAESVGGSTA